MINLKYKIQPEEIITMLKKGIQLKEVCQQILSQQIIDKAAQERAIILTTQEIQAEADSLRYTNHLVKASDTLAWLTDQLITAEDWEAGIRDRLLAQKLAEFLFAKEVEKYFVENKLDFEQVLLYRIVVPYEQLAQEIFYQIEEGEMSFYEAAHLYDMEERRRRECGYEGKLYRWNFKPDLVVIIFKARVGEILGPLRIDDASNLFMVEEFIPAELTPQRYQEILNTMFKQWLNSEINYKNPV
jgi:parvulin-like peptidyl-prolyl isomerase